MVAMIIKGLFRRYERWNPVHPTSGAFWGMGLGIGCGVGWGPGFGPEVVGYVGAGCGIGFSVGFTMAGIGIGLPANYVFRAPYNAIMATRSGALMLARSNGFPSARDVPKDGWNDFPLTSMFQRENNGRFSIFDTKIFLDRKAELLDMQQKLSVRTSSFSKVLGSFGSRFIRPPKGMED